MRPMTREEALRKFHIGWSALGYGIILMLASSFPTFGFLVTAVCGVVACLFLTVATLSPVEG